MATWCAGGPLQSAILLPVILFPFFTAQAPGLGQLLLSILVDHATSLSTGLPAVCPGLRESLGSDSSTRGVLVESGISTYDQCSVSFDLPPPLSPQAQRMLDDIRLFFIQSERLRQIALNACTAMNGSREAPATENLTTARAGRQNRTGVCLHTGELFSVQRQEVFKSWNSTCAFAELEKQISSTESSVEDLRARYVECITLLSRTVNLTRRVNFISCNVLQNVNNSINADDHLNEASCSSPAFHLLSALHDAYTNHACQRIFLHEFSMTFSSLDRLEKGFRRHYSIAEPSGDKQTSSLSVFKQSVVIFCTSMYPPKSFIAKRLSNPNATLFAGVPRLCDNVCHRVRNILVNISMFLDVGKSPVISLLRRQAENVCLQENETRTENCTDVDNRLITNVRPSSSSQGRLFCLNLTCHYPLQETSDPNHWTEQIQTDLRHLHNISSSFFPWAALPFNGTALPCGQRCESVEYSETERRTLRWVTALMGVLALLVNLVSIVAYLLNRRKLKHASRRLNVYVNIAFVLGPGGQAFCSAISPLSERLACYSDGTLRLNEPNSAEGASLCVVFTTMAMLGIYLLFFLFACLALEWYLMVSSLTTVENSAGSPESESRRLVIYTSLSTVLAMGMTIGALSTQRLVGVPAQGRCFLEYTHLFFFFPVPWGCITVVMCAFLGLGFPKLRRVYADLRPLQWQLQGHSSRADSPKHTRPFRTSKNVMGLRRLIKLTSAYLLTVSCSLIAIVVYQIFLFSSSYDLQESVTRHVRCRMRSCNPGSCSPLPSGDIGEVVVTDVYSAFCSIVFALWAFKGKLHSKIISSDMIEFFP